MAIRAVRPRCPTANGDAEPALPAAATSDDDGVVRIEMTVFAMSLGGLARVALAEGGLAALPERGVAPTGPELLEEDRVLRALFGDPGHAFASLRGCKGGLHDLGVPGAELVGPRDGL